MLKKQGIGWMISAGIEFPTGLIMQAVASEMQSDWKYYFDSATRDAAGAVEVVGVLFIIAAVISFICGLIIVITGTVEHDNAIYCKVCHRQIPRSYNVCPHCGYKIRTTSVDTAKNHLNKSQVKCIFCGCLVDENQPFCSQCGRKLEYNMSPQIKVQTQETTPKPKKPAEKWTCAVCAHVNLPWDNVCNNCGTKHEN